MCKIINFPVKESNGYNNLKNLFAVCGSASVCNEYLGMIEIMHGKGNITDREMYTLRRIGRQKRLMLAHPDTLESTVATMPGTYLYTPEMGGQKPTGCQIEAQLSYYGSHYHLKTVLELKGRGITKDDSHGKTNYYTVTKLAYEKLQREYKISYECFLD